MDTDILEESYYGEGILIEKAIKEAQEYIVFSFNCGFDLGKQMEFYNKYLGNLKKYVRIKDNTHSKETVNNIAFILTGYSQEEENLSRLPNSEALKRIENIYNSYKPNLNLVESKGE